MCKFTLDQALNTSSSWSHVNNCDKAREITKSEKWEQVTARHRMPCMLNVLGSYFTPHLSQTFVF
jgi:hypothetical protein